MKQIVITCDSMNMTMVLRAVEKTKTKKGPGGTCPTQGTRLAPARVTFLTYWGSSHDRDYELQEEPVRKIAVRYLVLTMSSTSIGTLNTHPSEHDSNTIRAVLHDKISKQFWREILISIAGSPTARCQEPS